MNGGNGYTILPNLLVVVVFLATGPAMVHYAVLGGVLLALVLLLIGWATGKVERAVGARERNRTEEMRCACRKYRLYATGDEQVHHATKHALSLCQPMREVV